MFAPHLRFVDVETTGASPDRARVTEIGVISVDSDGEQLRVSEWSSLVNPERPIPPEIRWLTGISDAMVRSAPPFAALADALLDRLRGGVLIAHNARFDYGFLRAEFVRAGLQLRMPTLCTVRLSRLLYPDRSPHTLDAIVARFGLDGEPRHRALGDARVLWRWLQLLYRRVPRAELEDAIGRLLARPSTPSHLAPDVLDAVPAAPGVYLMYGLNAHPIYIGKSVDLKARLAGHFAADTTRAADARLAQEVRRLEWHECAGEVDALLREAELVRTRLPAHNVRLRASRNAVVLDLDPASRPRWLALQAVPDALAGAPQPAGGSGLYGPFASRAAGRKALVALAAEHGLCLRTMGLERGPRGAAAPCFSFQLQRCRGACVGGESPAEHAQRLRAALARRELPRWPYAGAIALVEHGALRSAWHAADRWCWLGSSGSALASAAQAATSPRVFDASAYAILRAALARVPDPDGRLEVIEL